MRGIFYLTCLAVFSPLTCQAIEVKATEISDPRFPTQTLLSIQGDIHSGDSEKLAKVLDIAPLPEGTLVALNSVGGDLMEGMALGYLFRSKGFNTVVAKSSNSTLSKGACLSACVYAFTGGRYRYSPVEGGILGVHQFREGKPGQEAGVAEVQEVSSFLVNFLQKMEIDPRLFLLSTRANPKEFRALSSEEMTNLKVVNDGVGVSHMGLGWHQSKPALKISQDTDRGERRLTIVCHQKQTFVRVEADVSPSTVALLERENPVVSIKVDGASLFSKAWKQGGANREKFGISMDQQGKDLAQSLIGGSLLEANFLSSKSEGAFKFFLIPHRQALKDYLAPCSTLP